MKKNTTKNKTKQKKIASETRSSDTDYAHRLLTHKFYSFFYFALRAGDTLISHLDLTTAKRKKKLNLKKD